MQNKRMNIADIDAQKTHALGPDGTCGKSQNFPRQFALPIHRSSCKQRWKTL
jgi:hypothetical protein